MPKVQVVDKNGAQLEEIELSEAVFGIEPNVSAMHACVVNYLANQRQGTQSTLTRAEVSGGGKKPWRQKGTGRARQGSTRAPQWTHGGIALGPKPRSYRFVLNKKLRRLAMKSALSGKVLTSDLIVLDSFGLDAIKTKEAAAVLKAIGAGKKPLIVLDGMDDTVIKSTRNIEGAKTAQINNLNVYDIVNADKLVVLKAAVKGIEEVYA